MLILHHYPMSPFSEKLRLMLGYANVPWRSLLTTESPPRPDLQPLVGGYRRIPVAQDGADLFCDSRLIAAEIATGAKLPALNPFLADPDAQAISNRYEGEIFMAAITSIPPSRILRKLFKELSFSHALRFLKDRASMAGSAKTPPLKHAKALPLFMDHLAMLDELLVSGDAFLTGDEASHLDFAAYHTLWFRTVVGGQDMPTTMPALLQWYQRMTAFGHGDTSPTTTTHSFAAASEHQPREIPAAMTQDSRIGTNVSVAPDDYGLDETTGILVGIDEQRCIVARETTDFGTLHVHLPRMGFTID